MTINEIIYNIRNELKISRPDDLTISDRQLEFMVNYIREKILVQHLEKGRSISSIIKQDLGQVKLELVDKSQSIHKTKEYILRTIQKVPQPIELNEKDLFTYIGALDKETSYTYKTKANVRWNQYNKYASKTPIAYYSEGRIYVSTTNSLLSHINIEGVFLNPREVHKFKNPDGTSCYDPDLDQYPLSGRFIDMINDLIKTKELNIFLQISEDTTNNADSKS